MSQGPSGRIVVEIDSARKKQLYERLAGDDLTFKQWLLRHIDAYVGAEGQVRLFGAPTTESSALASEGHRS